jgi:excinuclease ABC subunit A
MVYQRHMPMEWSSRYEGVVNNLNRRYRQTSSQYIRDWIEGFMNNIPCHACEGARLRKESLAVTINGRNIKEVTDFAIREALNFFENLQLTEREGIIAHQILKEVKERLGFLVM